MKTTTMLLATFLASAIALGGTMAQAQSGGRGDGPPGRNGLGGNEIKGDPATGSRFGTTGNGTTATGNPGGRTTSGMVNQRGVGGSLDGIGTRSGTVR